MWTLYAAYAVEIEQGRDVLLLRHVRDKGGRGQVRERVDVVDRGLIREDSYNIVEVIRSFQI